MPASAFLHKDAGQLQQLKSPYEYLYLFAFEEGGFAVVSADDRVQPILGYSDKGVLSVEGMPPALAAWLADCDSVVRVAAGDNSLLMHSGWLEQGASKGPEGFDSIVGPLLLTTWDQSLPYNDSCPQHLGERALTGCVATSMAQLMKYWNWPDTGVGQRSYIDAAYGRLSADFGTTAYDWDNMPTALLTTSSAAQRTAVATLMLHCGVAVEMEYGPEEVGSGAYSMMFGQGLNYPCAENALRTHFKYAPWLRGVMRANCSDGEWGAMLKNGIDHGHPIINTAQVFGLGFGHQFLCDGYDTNGFFHFNWGWGGSGDGFYSLTSLMTQGYDMRQGHTAIVGIEPDTLWGSRSTCTVAAFSADSSLGVVTGGGEYTYRDTVLLCAVPAPGSRFLRWSNGVVDNPYPILAHDVSLTAFFTESSAEETGDVLSYTGTDVSNTAPCQMTTTDRLCIKFPATILPGHDFVGGIDFYHYGGEYVVYVHQGGEDAPGTVVYTQPFEISSGSLRWNHVEFETPVRIDTTQNLWITIRVLEPIALIGVPHLNIRDGNWVSTDNGATWQHLDELPRFASMSDSTFGWLLRCMTVHDSVVDPNRTPTAFLVAPEQGVVGDTVLVELLHSTVTTVEWDFGDAVDFRVVSDSAYVVWDTAGWQSVGARVDGIGGSVVLSKTILIADCNTPVSTFPYVLSFDDEGIFLRACWEQYLYGETRGYLFPGDYLNIYLGSGIDNRYVSPLIDISGDEPVWLDLTHKTPSEAIITVEVSQGGVEDSDFETISTLPAVDDVVNTQPINLSEHYQGNPVRISVRMRVQPDAGNVLFELHRLRVWKGSEGVQDAFDAKPSFTPNPALGRVAVSLPYPDGMLSLYDVTGRQVMHRQVSSTETTIDVSALSGGVYLLHYSSARGTSTTRLVVR